MKKDLSHIDEQDRPRMVDVSGKEVTRREAVAEAIVRFPGEIWSALKVQDFSVKKGSVINVAVVAGTMAAKKTADLIPFCHTLPLDRCTFDIHPDSEQPCMRIRCTVSCLAKTGVEMEALTGASVAALTIYDMTKSMGQGILIESTRLLAKSGGKEDFSVL